MFETVLVALDGSLYAEQALAPAAWIAQRTGAALRLVHVRSPAPGQGMLVPAHAQAATVPEVRMAAYLRACAERLARDTGAAATVAVAQGGAVAGILEQAELSNAGLIVLTTHGRGGVAEAWLGSVADGLARQAKVPVLFLRPQLPPVEPVMPVRHLLVPLDGSPESEQSIEPAILLAGLAGARITLVGVALLPIQIGDETEVGPHVEAAELWDSLRSYLARLAKRVGEAGVAADFVLRADIHAADAILDVADCQDVDLIVIATHGRSRLRRLFIGSVADKVLRAAHVPVLLVRPAEIAHAADSRAAALSAQSSDA